MICATVAGDNADEFAKNKKALHRLLCSYHLDTMTMKEKIADHVIERADYNLE